MLRYGVIKHPSWEENWIWNRLEYGIMNRPHLWWMIGSAGSQRVAINDRRISRALGDEQGQAALGPGHGPGLYRRGAGSGGAIPPQGASLDLGAGGCRRARGRELYAAGAAAAAPSRMVQFSQLLNRITNPVVMLAVFLVRFVPMGLLMRVWRDPWSAPTAVRQFGCSGAEAASWHHLIVGSVGIGARESAGF